MGRLRFDIPQDRLNAFCRTHRVRRLSVFGSALREDFRPDSDVDILVSFEEGAHHSLFDLVTMQDELEALLGRKVDLVEREAV
jgi:predicted nucleotidyltransferase